MKHVKLWSSPCQLTKTQDLSKQSRQVLPGVSNEVEIIWGCRWDLEIITPLCTLSNHYETSPAGVISPLDVRTPRTRSRSRASLADLI
jgi:hypothetical protein